MTLLRRVSRVAAAVLSSMSPLALLSLAIGLSALLALGWAGSPFRLHAPGAALWAAVAAAAGLVELVRAPHGSDRRFFAAVAVAIAAVALTEAAVVFVSFAPCGVRCV